MPLFTFFQKNSIQKKKRRQVLFLLKSFVKSWINLSYTNKSIDKFLFWGGDKKIIN